MSIIPETTAAAETVKDAATSARILSLLKENRIELIGCIILAHLLGVSDRVLGHFSGVCF